MTSRRCNTLFALFLTPLLIGLCSDRAAAGPVTWVNETNQASEADFVQLQSPTSLGTLVAGSTSVNILGEVFEAGETESGGANALILADLGYGAAGTDPRIDNSWVWLAAIFNTQLGNNDQYRQQFVAPLVNGNYSYTFRFSVDGGATYTAADLDGAGSSGSLVFDASQLGTFAVAGGTDPGPIATPEPATLVLVSLGGLVAHVRRRHRRQ
jgi:PEP-CTERM motif